VAILSSFARPSQEANTAVAVTMIQPQTRNAIFLCFLGLGSSRSFGRGFTTPFVLVRIKSTKQKYAKVRNNAQAAMPWMTGRTAGG
jgi:hypothetical protein